MFQTILRHNPHGLDNLVEITLSEPQRKLIETIISGQKYAEYHQPDLEPGSMVLPLSFFLFLSLPFCLSQLNYILSYLPLSLFLFSNSWLLVHP